MVESWPKSGQNHLPCAEAGVGLTYRTVIILEKVPHWRSFPDLAGVSVTCPMKKLEQPVHSQPDEHTRSLLHPEPLVGDAHSSVSSHTQNMAHPLEKTITAVHCILQVVMYSTRT